MSACTCTCSKEKCKISCPWYPLNTRYPAPAQIPGFAQQRSMYWNPIWSYVLQNHKHISTCRISISFKFRNILEKFFPISFLPFDIKQWMKLIPNSGWNAKIPLISFPPISNSFSPGNPAILRAPRWHHLNQNLITWKESSAIRFGESIGSSNYLVPMSIHHFHHQHHHHHHHHHQVWRQHGSSSYLVLVQTSGQQDSNANPGPRNVRWVATSPPSSLSYLQSLFCREVSLRQLRFKVGYSRVVRK